jgi:outer membrane protein
MRAIMILSFPVIDRVMRILRPVACLLLATLSGPLLAQGSIDLLDPSFRGDASIDSGAGEPRPSAPRLRAAIGPGFAVAPRFEGSDHDRARLVPALHLAYGPVYAGNGGLGVLLYGDRGWRLGANLSLGGRKESADPRLQGLGDVDRSVLAGLFAVYSSRHVAVRAHVASDVGGNGQGRLARLDVFGRLAARERLALFAGPGLTWADRRHMQTFFGVTADQAARSGYLEFAAKAGVSSIRLSAGSAYQLAPDWRIAALFTLARLEGDAGASPIVASRTQQSLFASVLYLWR